jgi:hypothetical protein
MTQWLPTAVGGVWRRAVRMAYAEGAALEVRKAGEWKAVVSHGRVARGATPTAKGPVVCIVTEGEGESAIEGLWVFDGKADMQTWSGFGSQGKSASGCSAASRRRLLNALGRKGW